MSKRKKIIFGLIAVILLGYLGFRFFGPTYIRVSDDGMAPTLNKSKFSLSDPLHGVIKIKKGNDLCLGCVVVFKHDDKLFISRIVGIPNDSISVSTDRSITLNGIKQKLNYVSPYINSNGMPSSVFETQTGQFAHQVIVDTKLSDTEVFKNFVSSLYLNGNSQMKDQCVQVNYKLTCKLGADTIFVMGDNRTSGKFGVFPVSEIVGIRVD